MPSHKIEIDQLKYLFQITKERMIPQSETMNHDLTKIFFDTIEDKITVGEIVNISICGEVRTGKSTAGLVITQFCNEVFLKLGLLPFKDINECMRQAIFSDQTEFLRFINKTERNYCVNIDEFNNMAKTGLNATTEETLFDYYSNVFAGKHISRVSHSPDIVQDKNSNIILYTYGRDEKNGIVQCILFYRDIVTKEKLCIGKVLIDVKEVTKNWYGQKLKYIIETKGITTPEEAKFVDYWREHDWYVMYQYKKFKRMELLDKHHLRDIREPEMAPVVLLAVQEMEDSAKLGRLDRELISTIVDQAREKKGRIYSILASMEITTKVSAILSLYTKIFTLTRKVEHPPKTMTEEQIQLTKQEIGKWEAHLTSIIKRQQELSAIYDEFLNIK